MSDDEQTSEPEQTQAAPAPRERARVKRERPRQPPARATKLPDDPTDARGRRAMGAK